MVPILLNARTLGHLAPHDTFLTGTPGPRPSFSVHSARGLPQRGTTSSYGLDPQANQSDENPLPKRGIKKGALDASKDAFNTLLADADAQIAALPRPPVAPAPPPPQDAELPWRGSFYENRVRKVGGKRP